MELLNRGSKINEELSQLLILDAIEKEEGLKQRDISKATGLNLFKVNFLLRRMFEKGYVKFKYVYNNPNKRSYLYLLTPEGFARKTKLVYKFIKVTLENYNILETRMIDNCENIVKFNIKKVILSGTNNVIQIFERIAKSYDLEILGIINFDNRKKLISGHKIISKQDLKQINYDKIFLLYATSLFSNLLIQLQFAQRI